MGTVINHLQSLGIIPSAWKSSHERRDDQKHVRMDCQIENATASTAHTALSVPLLYRFLMIFGRPVGITLGSLFHNLCDLRHQKTCLDCRRDS